MGDKAMNQQTKQTFTIVHMNSSHKTLRMAVSCVEADSMPEANARLIADSKAHGETIQFLCVFRGRHENLLDGTFDGTSHVQPSTRPSDTIQVATNLPKHGVKGK